MLIGSNGPQRDKRTVIKGEMEGGRKREGLGGRERRSDDDAESPIGFSAIPVTGCSASTGCLDTNQQTYFVHILHKEQRPSLVVFSSRLSRNEIINQDNHTPQGENNEYNSGPCSPITTSPPCFLPNPYLIPTQPEPDPSLAYVAAYIPSTHSLTADKNSDPFKWYPVVLRR